MIYNTFTFIFTWSLFLLFTSAAAPVKDTLYYDLLGVDPKSDVALIRFRCVNFPLPDSNRFVWKKEDALRLHQIVRDVCQILLDIDSRREYDREGPTLHFTVNEFSQVYIDELIIQMLSYDDRSDCAKGLVGTPFLELCIAHANNEIGRFFEGLRILQGSIYASYIHNHPNPPPVTVKFSLYLEKFFGSNPPYKPRWNSLDDLKSFLDQIIRVYGPYLDASSHRDPTIFDRLKVMRRQLEEPTRFMTAFSNGLSRSSVNMLFRTDPLGSLRTYLTSDHPVFKPNRVNTNVGGEVQPMDEEEERIRMHDAKRKLAYAKLQENYNNNQQRKRQKK